MDHNFEPVLDTFGELPPFVFESQIEDPFAISTFDFLDSDYDPLEEPVDETIDWFQTYFTNGQFPATIEHEPTESLQALHSWPDPTAAALDRGQTTPATTPEDSPAIPGRMDGADQQLTMPADKNCPEFVPQPRRKQPSEAAREILEEALKLELYPDKTETQKIAERAQMSFKQVRDWFRNQRRRRPLQQLYNLQDMESSSSSVALTHKSLEALESSSTPAPESVAQNVPFTLHKSKSVASFRSQRSGASGHSRQSGVSGRTNRSAVSAASARSGRSCMSISSRVSKRSTGRKGRRIVPPGKFTKAKATCSTWDDNTESTAPYGFRCTFCWKGFSTKFSWRRHESSVHVHAKRWICNPPDTSGLLRKGHVVCPFCSNAFGDWQLVEADYIYHKIKCRKHSNPRCRYCSDKALERQRNDLFDFCRTSFLSHLSEHGTEACQHRPKKDRTFYRKEHMTQHLISFHNATPETLAGGMLPDFIVVESSVSLDHPGSRCPFCPHRSFNDWDRRLDHVAAHYTESSELNATDYKEAMEISSEWMLAYEEALLRGFGP